MSDVRLKVNGILYGGWKTVRIQRSIEQIAGKFELTVTERWAGQDTPRPIRPGEECQVLIDGEPVITGYIDDVDIIYNDTSHTVAVSGRDKTGDLVDCSTSLKDKQWAGQSLFQMAERFCSPFKIAVVAEVDAPEKFRTITTETGASVFEALDAAAKVRAVLLISDGNGRLLITRASQERIQTVLWLGDNVRACSATFSHKDRYSEYTVLGQGAADDFNYGSAAAHASGRATDAFIERHRPLTIISDRDTNLAQAQTTAEWERNVRYGQSQRLRYTVAGWHYETGKLWPINRLVPVRDDLLGLDVDRLITGTEFILDESGERSEITLMPREAFDLIPLPEPAGDNYESL